MIFSASCGGGSVAHAGVQNLKLTPLLSIVFVDLWHGRDIPEGMRRHGPVERNEVERLPFGVAQDSARMSAFDRERADHFQTIDAEKRLRIAVSERSQFRVKLEKLVAELIQLDRAVVGQSAR